MAVGEKQDSDRLCAWGVIHNSHGTYVDRICFFPVGEKPDTDIAWVRLPWLDEPERKLVELSHDDREALQWAHWMLAKFVTLSVDEHHHQRALAVLDKLMRARLAGEM